MHEWGIDLVAIHPACLSLSEAPSMMPYRWQRELAKSKSGRANPEFIRVPCFLMDAIFRGRLLEREIERQNDKGHILWMCPLQASWR